MLKLRPNTLKEIQSILDESYFTKDSFVLENNPIRKSFLRIEFTPEPKYVFIAKENKGEYVTIEKPGIYLENEEEFKRENFSFILHAVYSWVDRIKEDLDSNYSVMQDGNLEYFIKKIKQFFSKYENTNEYFKRLEIIEISGTLSDLDSSICNNKKELFLLDADTASFHNTVESLKKDLNIYPKNVWCVISKNKIIKDIRRMIDKSSFNNKEDLQYKILENIN